jgi:hypothetical protein
LIWWAETDREFIDAGKTHVIAWPGFVKATVFGSSRLADDRVDDSRELFAGLGQGIKVVLAGAAGFDQTAMPEQSEVMAYRGLALGAEIGAELRHVSFFLTKEHEYLKARWVRYLLEELGNAADFCRGTGLGGGGVP